MIIHITRHGQPAVGDLAPGTDHQYPPGDPFLTTLGREQASLLGKRLAAGGFSGPIFSSPYRRTLDTAQCIAEQTGALIRPERAMQEWIHNTETPEFDGMPLAQIRELYSHIAPDAELAHPWFFKGPEGDPEVQARVRPFLEKLLTLPYSEVLLVGHGASTGACNHLLAPGQTGDLPANDISRNWNCSLTTIKATAIGAGQLVRLFDTAHLPEASITSNQLRYVDAE